MISLGLTAVQQQDLIKLLGQSHGIYPIIRILDLDHRALADVSDRFVTGQVNIDTTAEVTRSASLDLIDPTASLGLDSLNPSNGSVFINRMIQIIYVVYSPDLTRVYSIPLFTGPINVINRAGALVSIEAQGKEVIAQQSIRGSLTYRAGTTQISIIRSLMDAVGETKYQFEDFGAYNPSTLTLVRGDNNFWGSARTVASNIGARLFYDGRGVLQLRRPSTQSKWVFDGTNSTSEPQPSYSLDDLTNAVLVTGGGTTTPRWYFPNSAHELSPQNLGRAGKGRYFTQFIDDDSLTTISAMDSVGNSTLRAGLLQSIELDFDAYPMPLLEEYDVYTYSSPSFVTNAVIQSMSIPLVPNAMSVGSVRQVTPQRFTFRKV